MESLALIATALRRQITEKIAEPTSHGEDAAAAAQQRRVTAPKSSSHKAAAASATCPAGGRKRVLTSAPPLTRASWTARHFPELSARFGTCLWKWPPRRRQDAYRPIARAPGHRHGRSVHGTNGARRRRRLARQVPGCTPRTRTRPQEGPERDAPVPSTTGFRALSPASNGRCCGVGPALSPVYLVPWPVQPRKPGQHLLGHPASPAARMRTARVGGATDRGERAGASQDRGCKRRGNVAAALSAARAGVAAGDPFAWSIPKPDRRPPSNVGALIQCGHQMITQKSSRKDQWITCGDGGPAVPRVTCGNRWTDCE